MFTFETFTNTELNEGPCLVVRLDFLLEESSNNILWFALDLLSPLKEAVLESIETLLSESDPILLAKFSDLFLELIEQGP